MDTYTVTPALSIFLAWKPFVNTGLPPPPATLLTIEFDSHLEVATLTEQREVRLQRIVPIAMCGYCTWDDGPSCIIMWHAASMILEWWCGVGGWTRSPFACMEWSAMLVCACPCNLNVAWPVTIANCIPPRRLSCIPAFDEVDENWKALVIDF